MKRLTNDIIDDNNSNSGLKTQKLEDGNRNNETLSIRDACDIALLWTSAKVSIGEKLFVRWIISIESNKSNGNEDNVDEEDVFWWPCKVCFNNNVERDSKGRRIWYLEYDEIKGFKSDKCKVIFENNERVKHIDYENISLRFLRESDNQELRKKIDIEEDEEFRDSKIEDIEISLEEILKEDQYVDSNGDNSNESDNLMNLFNVLPHEKKISLALGYRQFADKFLEFLHKKIGKNSNNTTIITSLDIQEFIRNLGLEDHLNNKDKFK